MKLENIKTALANLLFQMEEIKMAKLATDKGILSYEGEELMIDMEVKIVDEEGNEVSVEDGDYVTEDGTTISIKDGKVVSIVEKETEVEPEKPIEEEPEKVEAEEETPIEEEPKEEEKPNEVEMLRGEIEALTARIEALEKLIEDLNGKPADKPAEEQFEAIKRVENVPLKGKDRARALFKLR